MTLQSWVAPWTSTEVLLESILSRLHQQSFGTVLLSGEPEPSGSDQSSGLQPQV